MSNFSKDDILASSSGWVSALLNFFPGLGVGYIYQRRWKAYWATTISSTLWLLIGFYKQFEVDPSDPAQINNNDISAFIGLFSIATFTALEAWYRVQKAKRVTA